MANNSQVVQNNENDNAREIDILHILKALWKRWWIILVAGVLIAVLALLYVTMFVPESFSSEIMLYVNNTSANQSSSVSQSDITASRSLVQTYIVMLKNRTTMEAIIKKAQDEGYSFNYNYKQLLGMISASAVNNTEVFSVTVTAGDPEDAYLIARLIGDVLPNLIENYVENSKMSTVQEAKINRDKVAPSRTKYVIIGFVIGIILSAGVIAVIDIFDTTIREDDYVVAKYDIPILAKIPDLTVKDSGKYYKYGHGKYGHGKYGRGQYGHGAYGDNSQVNSGNSD